MDIVRSTCPTCCASVDGHESHVGKKVRCRKCKQSFVFVARSNQDTLAPVETPDTFDSLENDSGAAARSAGVLGSLGRFKLHKVLGEGAFGRVYLAFDPQLDRPLALKVPTFDVSDTQRVARFLNEAKAAAQLRHPNIVPTYETGSLEGRHFIASQYIPGRTLGRLISEQQPDIEQSVDWIMQICDAVEYAHSQGIVHRDIKPDNIIIDIGQNPQVMDFGLARRDATDSNLTTDGSVMGTPAYMPPEQARGDSATVGPQSDQYSIGVVLYELLTRQRPFSGEPHQVVADVINKEPRRVRLVNENIPRDLEAIVGKAMSKEVRQRYASVAALKFDLLAWKSGEPTEARAPNVAEKTIRWYRRNAVVATLSMGVIALALATSCIASIGYWRVSTLRNKELALQSSMEKALKREQQIGKELQEAKETADRKTQVAEQKTREAEANLLAANEAKRRAISSAQEVEKQRLKAAEESSRAIAALQAQMAAEKKLTTANTESAALKKQLAKKSYEQMLQLAADSMNSADALAALENCAVEKRGWEWRFLAARSNNTLKRSTVPFIPKLIHGYAMCSGLSIAVLDKDGKTTLRSLAREETPNVTNEVQAISQLGNVVVTTSRRVRKQELVESKYRVWRWRGQSYRVESTGMFRRPFTYEDRQLVSGFCIFGERAMYLATGGPSREVALFDSFPTAPSQLTDERQARMLVNENRYLSHDSQMRLLMRVTKSPLGNVAKPFQDVWVDPVSGRFVAVYSLGDKLSVVTPSGTQSVAVSLPMRRLLGRCYLVDQGRRVLVFGGKTVKVFNSATLKHLVTITLDQEVVLAGTRSRMLDRDVVLLFLRQVHKHEVLIFDDTNR